MKLLKYFHEVKDELTKVTWPTKAESIKLTYIVVGASLLVGLYIGGLDVGFTSLLGLFIN